MMPFDDDLAQVYGRALIAIARADGEIDAEEGERLERVLQTRTRQPVSLEDLLFEPSLRAEELVAMLEGNPFRGNGFHPRDIGRLLIADAVQVAFARDGITNGEELLLLR